MEDETTTDSASAPSGGNEPQTINGVAVDDQGQAIPVPEEGESSTTAVDEPSEEPQGEQPSEESTGASEEAVPDEDTKKLQSFAKGQGIDDISQLSKREQSLLKSAYDTKAEYDRQRQISSELEKASKITSDQIPEDFSPEQRDNVRTRNVELTLDVMRWKQNNPDKLAQEQAMVGVLTDPNKRLMVQEGLLTLDDVYHIAKATSGTDADLKSQGGKEALEKLAHKQQAAVPRGNAVNSAPVQEAKITPQNVDQLVGSHDLKWFEANREAINKAMAG